MGWKNVKEHYGITHIVQVTEKGICIGSSYVHNIIVIRPGLKIGRSHIGGAEMMRLVAAMEADRSKLRALIEAPDTFAASIPVYTFTYDGEIVKKFCEAPGWPNITHDGQLMYDNTHFLDRAQAVAKARAELEASVQHRKDRCAWLRVELTQAEERRWAAEGAVARLVAAEGPP